jgi:hypothetical protein
MTSEVKAWLKLVQIAAALVRQMSFAGQAVVGS